MSRKQVQRDRRRTERTMADAFAALERGEQVLALRLARRARERGAMNPRILLDHAEVARACGDDDEAEESLRSAIAQAPNFAPAFAALAELQAARGRWPQAVRLLARAVDLAPADSLAAARLQEWRARLPEVAAGGAPAPVDTEPAPVLLRTQGCDVDALHAAITARGFAVLDATCSPDECTALRAAFTIGDGLDRELRLRGDGDVGCATRWFLSPLSEPVAALQRELFPLAAELANRTLELLRDAHRHPRAFDAWRRSRGGGGRAAARLLAFAGADALPPERTADRRAFPLRVCVDLGPGDAAESLRMIDVRPGRKVRATKARTRAGDGILFCCRERPQQVGGAWGLQIVQWSCGPFAVPRFVLDLPFDDE